MTVLSGVSISRGDGSRRRRILLHRNSFMQQIQIYAFVCLLLWSFRERITTTKREGEQKRRWVKSEKIKKKKMKQNLQVCSTFPVFAFFLVRQKNTVLFFSTIATTIVTNISS